MGDVRAARPRPVLIATVIVALLFTLLGITGRLFGLGLFFAGLIPVVYGIIQLMKRRANLGVVMTVTGVGLGLTALVVTGVFPPPQPQAPIAAEPVAQLPAPVLPSAPPTTAQQVLALLPVQPSTPANAYDRDSFGWNSLDFDRNGCDQRNDVLKRDLTEETIKPNSHECRIEAGVLQDRYSDTAMRLRRDEVDIDHVVALGSAWTTGAADWPADKRKKFANDPLNLIATQPSLNTQKGAQDLTGWLPPAQSYHCGYVARQLAVKHAYGLSVTEAEKATAGQVLAGCPDQPLPDATEPAPLASRTVESPREVAARQQAEQEAKERAARDQAARDQAAQAERDRAAADQAAKDQAARDQAARDQAARDQQARDRAAQEASSAQQAQPTLDAPRVVAPAPRAPAPYEDSSSQQESSADSGKKYKNCGQLNADYPHGVGKPGAKDKGGTVSNFEVDSAVYDLNTGRDRDNDGIACEKE